MSGKVLGDVEAAIEYSLAQYVPARIVFDYGNEWDEDQ